MYADLKKHKDSIISNPIVRALNGDTSALQKIPSDILNFDFDRQKSPKEIFQIVDADASQQDAILMAKKGVSFVLQGPPGTGKSQTITNIIAESLASGKKVLFVSEKMAALDVVHKRLAAADLDDFCLVLHSYKANKKSVLEQLGHTLDLCSHKSTLSDEAYRKLDVLQEDREKLNEYADEIYETVEPLGKSIYEANGIIANLESYADYIFSIDDIRNTTKEKYNSYISKLSLFVRTMGKMSLDYKHNPWRGCRLTYVTNEFRHDALFHLKSLMPQVDDANRQFASVLALLKIKASNTMRGIDAVIDVLMCAKTAYRIPVEWISTDELQPLYNEVAKCKELKERVIALKENLEKEYAIIGKNESTIGLEKISAIENSVDAINETTKLTTYVKSVTPYSHLINFTMADAEKLLNKSEEQARVIQSQKAEILEEYDSNIFQIDYLSMLKRMKTEYTSFFRFLKKDYKKDKKSILLCRKNLQKKISYIEMQALIQKLNAMYDNQQWYFKNSESINSRFDVDFSEDTDYSELRKKISTCKLIQNAIKILNSIRDLFYSIEVKDETLKKNYSFLYKGIFSDWETVIKALDWAKAFKSSLSGVEASPAYIKDFCAGNEIVSLSLQVKSNLENIRDNISPDFKWFVSNFSDENEFYNMELPILYDRLSGCINGLSLLEDWIDFKTIRENCVSVGLTDFIQTIEANDISAEDVVPVFKKRFFRLWLDAVLPEYPAVLNFRRKNQESTIKEFDTLDKLQFGIAKAGVRSKLINALPAYEHFTTGVDEISTLKRELAKQRKIMPIRRLFNEIPNLLLTLKPCLMMSPLSVSLFLEAEIYKFDLVIFDEASQVCTENAIGAISRAKQAIIAGDSKQLPPTNFFQAAIGDVDYDDENEDELDDSDAYESILDEAAFLPERTLRWHYRSRHESLIAFSNAKIYRNNLITFPSNIENTENNGVEYIYVKDGYYDRGGRKGNVIEAQVVAELVFKHFKEQPQRSLGVIAFGEIQQQAIEAAILKRRLKEQEFEPFFAEDKENAFFIKNLENVQGDERDSIIFSIGYAKDQNGTFRMNFGPLSKTGGERRLNVAITRAKYNVKLVGSILPTDINLEKINSEGPKLLRAYIDFAINGQSVLDREITENDKVEYDSPFEEAVYNFLDRKGYRLTTQVGCSGYRRDMAVKHPQISGVYVLGIECDGASYHSARTARERDRLRQEVLENMGWKIYRIWSTDWIKDPKTEGDKLLKAVDNAIACYGDVSVEPIDDYNKSDVEPKDFICVEEKSDIEISTANSYGFEKRKKVDFSTLKRNKNGYLKIADCIMAVINAEYPIHYELLCQQLAPLYGNKKATVKIRREVNYGLIQLGKRIVRNNDFFFPAGL